MDNVITGNERVDYALSTLRRWIDCLEANAEHDERRGRDDAARGLRFRASELRDVVRMLDGTEDDYIASLRH